MNIDLNITEGAIRQMKKLGADEDTFVRLSVKRGGCAGMKYDAVLDDVLSDEDRILYDHDNLRIVTHWQLRPHLDGLTIDFSDDLIRPGFTLTNPNAETSCGCGASFASNGITEITL